MVLVLLEEVELEVEELLGFGHTAPTPVPEAVMPLVSLLKGAAGATTPCGGAAMSRQ